MFSRSYYKIRVLQSVPNGSPSLCSRITPATGWADNQDEVTVREYLLGALAMGGSDKKKAGKGGGGSKGGGGGPKEPLWTLEKVRALSDEDVRGLKANAERLANQLVFEMCDIVLEERRPPPRASVVKYGTITRTAKDKREEKDSAALLEVLAVRLLERFDLSKETAKRLSAGTKRFIAHSFVGKNGIAKVSGGQKSNGLIFGRYISYRLRDESCHINIVKFPSQDKIIYEVMGSKHFFTEPKPLAEMRPYLKDGESIGIFEWGQEFADFETAAEFFEHTLEKFAPLK